jgi:hypothetical protein
MRKQDPHENEPYQIDPIHHRHLTEVDCSPLRIIYIGNVILAKTLATVTDIDNKVTEYVLNLATLGDATRNTNIPICFVQPKVAKASTMVTVTCCCHWHYRGCYRSKICQCKHSLTTNISSSKAC